MNFTRKAGLLGAASMGILALVLVGGCEKPRPGETYAKKSVAWPLFDQERREGINPDGIKWQMDKGDMIVWLGSWDKMRTYDQNGVLIYRKERSTFIPFYNAEVEESPEFITKHGGVLFFPYYSRQARTPVQEVKVGAPSQAPPVIPPPAK